MLLDARSVHTVDVVVADSHPSIQRREERRETNWIAMIRLPDGTEIPTTVKDVSPSGARLAVPSSYTLPHRFMFKVVGRDLVCAVELAWREGEYAGVVITRMGKFAGTEVKSSIPKTTSSAVLARRSRFSRS